MPYSVSPFINQTTLDVFNQLKQWKFHDVQKSLHCMSTHISWHPSVCLPFRLLLAHIINLCSYKSEKKQFMNRCISLIENYSERTYILDTFYTWCRADVWTYTQKSLLVLHYVIFYSMIIMSFQLGNLVLLKST